MPEKRANNPSPTEEGGVRGSPIVYVEPTRRRPHRCRIPTEGFREYIMSKGWAPWGAFARKSIRRGFEVWMFSREKHPDYIVVELIPQNDFWAKITRETRERDALEHRGSFRLVSPETEGGGE